MAAIWPVFLERLGEKKMSLAAYLAEAKPLRVEGGVVTVGLPGFALHQEVLTIVEHRRLIEGLLSELAQSRLSVRYTTLPAAARSVGPGQPPPPLKPEPAVPPVVQDIVNLFNATILDRPPRPSP